MRGSSDMLTLNHASSSRRAPGLRAATCDRPLRRSPSERAPGGAAAALDLNPQRFIILTGTLRMASALGCAAIVLLTP